MIYSEFIASLIESNYNVILPIKTSDGGAFVPKIGALGKVPVQIETYNTFSVSFRCKITFHKYEQEFIHYANTASSPDSILSKFYRKVDSVVYKTLLENNEQEYMDDLHQQAIEKLSSTINFRKVELDNGKRN